MRWKFGSEYGNRGAIIRWGKYLDNGIWLTPLELCCLRWRRHCDGSWFLRIWIFDIHWGNK